MDRPGPRDVALTPYVVAFERAIDAVETEMGVLVCGSQMGKSEAVLDIIGHRFDQRPTPALYVGPSQDFITDEIEPRVMDLINSAPTLAKKITRGKKNKRFRKVLGGVPLKFAWAGSPTQLAGTTAGLVAVDEYDRMSADVKGEGDPLTMTKARGFTFKGRRYIVTSTPLVGNIDIYKCTRSGLEFWKRMPAEDIQSPTWKLWQSGTMYHFAWPCPCCGEYFVPRFKCLKWPKDATPSVARAEAYLECPRCGGVIEDEHKAEMNRRGVYVAPGQTVTKDGIVDGDPPRSSTASFWVSGLCSPFVTIGERAEAFVEATLSGDQGKIQGVINTGYGELWAPGGGDVPEWTEVAKLRQPYRLGDLPAGMVTLTIGVDVQKNGLYYAIRAWGARASSWLVDRGILHGETHEAEVWDDLADLITTPIHGHYIKRGLVDSGFRPGKREQIPFNRVYDFCRRFSRIVSPAKGRATQTQPVRKSKIEVTIKGSAKKHSLELMLLDTDHFKSWVHERIRYPQEALGAWLLPEDVDDEYCAQIVSEARIKKPSGTVQWVQRRRDNHFLDCEALNAAAGHLLNVQRIREGRGLRAGITGRDDLDDELAAESEDTITPEPAREPEPIAAPAAVAAVKAATKAAPVNKVHSVKRVAAPPPARRMSWADMAARLNH